MKRLLLLSLFLLPFTTFAAGPDVKGITRDWGFSGPFGKYDKSIPIAEIDIFKSTLDKFIYFLKSIV